MFNESKFTIHASSFGDTFEDIGDKFFTFQDACQEADDLWPGAEFQAKGNITIVTVNGNKVAEIHGHDR